MIQDGCTKISTYLWNVLKDSTKNVDVKLKTSARNTMETETHTSGTAQQDDDEEICVCDEDSHHSVRNKQVYTGQYISKEALARRFDADDKPLKADFDYMSVDCNQEERDKEHSDTRKRDTKWTYDYHCDTRTHKNKTDTNEQRSKINTRERKRMHDLNTAMESLREVMPYANGPSVRKLSKIATISLARNYIQTLARSVDELKLMLEEAYRSQGAGAMTRRRIATATHPYTQFLGIRALGSVSGVQKMLNTHCTAGFEQYANYGNFNGTPRSACIGFGCCNDGHSVHAGLPHTYECGITSRGNMG